MPISALNTQHAINSLIIVQMPTNAWLMANVLIGRWMRKYRHIGMHVHTYVGEAGAWWFDFGVLDVNWIFNGATLAEARVIGWICGKCNPAY